MFEHLHPKERQRASMALDMIYLMAVYVKGGIHFSDITMSSMASEITGVSIVYTVVCSDAIQRIHQSSASLAFVREIHQWPVYSPHKRPITWKMVPFDDVFMSCPAKCLKIFAVSHFNYALCEQLEDRVFVHSWSVGFYQINSPFNLLYIRCSRDFWVKL